MRIVLLVAAFSCAGCATTTGLPARDRRPVERDVEGYAIASCLASQAEPYLRDQGDAWAAVIVQRMKGDLDSFVAVGEQVKRELSAGHMAIIRDESVGNGDKVLPVLYCSEIIDQPAVRRTISQSIVALQSAYEE